MSRIKSQDERLEAAAADGLLAPLREQRDEIHDVFELESTPPAAHIARDETAEGDSGDPDLRLGERIQVLFAGGAGSPNIDIPRSAPAIGLQLRRGRHRAKEKEENQRARPTRARQEFSFAHKSWITGSETGVRVRARQQS